MKRLLMVMTAVAVLVPASLWAQETPKAEVFGGFSILTSKSGTTRITAPGWQASVTANLNERFAVVGDFSGNYKDDVNTCVSCKSHACLGGVRVGNRTEKATVFGHALLGGTRGSSAGASETNFTLGFGGGVDINTSEKMAIRIIQFDWLPTKFDNGAGGSDWQTNNLRFGFGIVFKSGSK